jgi:hypothetical protein
MKRSIIIVACAVVGLLVVALAGSLWYFHDRRFDVVITQQQIDDALQSSFPISKNHLLILHITYSNPRVTLLSGTNRVEVALDADLEIQLRKEPRRLHGTFVATTGISYRSDTYQFFLAEPDIDKLTIQGIPKEYLDNVTPFASSLARERLQKFPIYTLKGENIKSRAVKFLLKDVQVKSNEVHATLGI